MNLIDKYLPEAKKKKKINISIDRDIMDLKKSIRIPTVKGNQYFKDKKRYTRKKKHKQKYQ